VVSGQTAAGSPPGKNQGNQASNFCYPQPRRESIDTANRNALIASSSQADANLIQTPRGLSLAHGLVSPPASEIPHIFKSSGGSRMIDHVSISQSEINELFQMQLLASRFNLPN
jgi:hypothetical protein